MRPLEQIKSWSPTNLILSASNAANQYLWTQAFSITAALYKSSSLIRNLSIWDTNTRSVGWMRFTLVGWHLQSQDSLSSEPMSSLDTNAPAVLRLRSCSSCWSSMGYSWKPGCSMARADTAVSPWTVRLKPSMRSSICRTHARVLCQKMQSLLA